VGVARVLVVDDEPNICALLSATLRHVGYQVRVAHAGAQALTVAEEYRPDLAVLDVLLRRRGGSLRPVGADPAPLATVRDALAGTTSD